MQNNNLKRTLGKQENADGHKRQEAHGDKSEREKKKKKRRILIQFLKLVSLPAADNLSSLVV